MTKSRVLSYVYPQLLESHQSKYNGEVKVFQFLGKPFISVGNLTQSGGLVTKIWKSAVDHTRQTAFKHKPPENVLILGLGAGSSIHYIVKTWPQIKVTGIEIDPVMIEMGRKYFNLDTYPHLKIINADVFEWLQTNKTTFDVIFVDMYQGRKVPKGAETSKFLKSINNMVTTDGIAVFNRLAVKENKQANSIFTQNLKKEFKHVNRIKTPVNQVYAVGKEE